MNEETRRELHTLLDRMIDRGETIGVLQHAGLKDVYGVAPSDREVEVITYHLSLRESKNKR